RPARADRSLLGRGPAPDPGRRGRGAPLDRRVASAARSPRPALFGAPPGAPSLLRLRSRVLRPARARPRDHRGAPPSRVRGVRRGRRRPPPPLPGGSPGHRAVRELPPARDPGARPRPSADGHRSHRPVVPADRPRAGRARRVLLPHAVEVLSAPTGAEGRVTPARTGDVGSAPPGGRPGDPRSAGPRRSRTAVGAPDAAAPTS